KARIERVLRADGKEEVLHVPDPQPSPAPTAELVARARLVLALTGASFWQAWDRRDAPADPSLRLEARLDEEVIASWTDARLDPQDMPGAVVNTFVFSPADAAGRAAPEVLLSPPEAQPGRVLLRLDLPAGAMDARKLRLAYQANEGTVEEPAWHDLVSTTVAVSLHSDAPVL